ncbi:MAG: ABC transporter ATP-binding protein [Planctomycetes bacterium]|nr:ABC transporter ATP-binding protein [Planctomycetota bacterium]
MQTLTEPAVALRGVTKSYGEGAARVTALRGIDLDIGTGELMMLVGPSGCGKTTLISVIAGILDQDDGACSVFGRDLRAMRGMAKARFRGETVGFVFQAFNLLPALNAAENVSIPLLLAGLKRSEALERSRAMLDRVGIGERWRSRPAQLSGGQQQRVAIARALVHQPRLVVCDEPTSSLDHETGARVMEIMREVAMQGSRTLVVVTHDARIFSYADRIAVMDDGKVVKVVHSAKELQDAP